MSIEPTYGANLINFVKLILYYELYMRKFKQKLDKIRAKFNKIW